MKHYSVIVLGAGMSGLCIGAKLREAGIGSFRIFEKASSVGGTWRDNTYPGVACDVPSHLYSFSFYLNPNWSRAFSPGAEINAYCERFYEKSELSPYIQFNAEIVRAEYLGKRWKVSLKDGECFTADVLVSGLGGLHTPNYPDIPGMDSFAGKVFHSARWDHNYDITGKRVAIIGTGSSAIQIAPEIAPKVKMLKLFQRTPAWVFPRWDSDISESHKHLLGSSPIINTLKRWLIWLRLEWLGMCYTKRGSWTNKLVSKMILRNIRNLVDDPDIQGKLSPNYEVGCKRICLSDDYYPIFNADNVELVTSGMEEITPEGIRTTDGKTFEFDAIVLATGFKPFNITDQVDFVGMNGVSLKEQWSSRIKAYRSVMAPNFPNLFIMLGPNSGTGHMSAIQMIEAQAKYIVRSIKLLSQQKLSSIEPREKVVAELDVSLQGAMKSRVFSGGCHAWYNDKDDKNFTLWPHSTVRYWWELRKPKLAEMKVESLVE